MHTNIRNGRHTTRAWIEGARSYRHAPIEEHASLNLAKRENGLNATTGKFPPSIDEIHSEAIEEDRSY